MLADAGFLYHEQDYLSESEHLKNVIINQSFNGTFFVDHAIRINNQLVVQKETTETCQYYALFTEISSGEIFKKHKQLMFEKFGYNRDLNNAFSNISRSNAFIGNYLRLECLINDKKYQQVIEECKGFFGYMANRTGTLWEDIRPTISCNHGFASYVVNWLVQAIFGYIGRDDQKKELYFERVQNQINAKITLPILSQGLTIINYRGTIEIQPVENYKVVFSHEGT
jgi:alpha-L-rhamnosidase